MFIHRESDFIRPTRWVPFHDENHKFIPQTIGEM